MNELRLALRTMLRDRGTSALAVLALGLALGVNTGLFSAVHAVLLRTLPFAAPDRVATLLEGSFTDAETSEALSGGDLAQLPGEIHAFSDIAGWRVHAFNAGTGGTPVRLPGAVASRSFFRVFPARVLAGRPFDPQLPRGVREVVVSERLWRRMFNADPGLIGRTLSLNGEPVPVVGVIASEFAVPPEAEVWISPRFSVPDHPLRPLQDQSSEYGSTYAQAAGRLAPGATFAAAQSELDAYSRRRGTLHPDTSGADGRVRILPFREELVGPVRPTLLLLWGASLFTLVLACSNVGALLLARAIRRRHELVVRLALGASRARMFRMFCLEGLVLAAAGAMLGVILAALMPPLLLALWPQQLSAEMLRPSAAVLAFTAGLAGLTTLGISVAPALLGPGDGGALRAQDPPVAGGPGPHASSSWRRRSPSPSSSSPRPDSSSGASGSSTTSTPGSSRRGWCPEASGFRRPGTPTLVGSMSSPGACSASSTPGPRSPMRRSRRASHWPGETATAPSRSPANPRWWTPITGW